MSDRGDGGTDRRLDGFEERAKLRAEYVAQREAAIRQIAAIDEADDEAAAAEVLRVVSSRGWTMRKTANGWTIEKEKRKRGRPPAKKD